jgi:hypothetical protein
MRAGKHDEERKMNKLIAMAAILTLTLLATATLAQREPLQAHATKQPIKAQPNAYMQAEPYFSIATQGPGASGTNYTAICMGETFNVTVSVNNLDAGYQAVGFEFKLGYNNTMLSVVGFQEGPWLDPFGAPPSMGIAGYNYSGWNYPDNDQYYIQIGVAVAPNSTGQWNPPYPSGSGVLATITFTCTTRNTYPAADLTCPLTLFDTIFTNSSADLLPQDTPVSGVYVMKSAILGDVNGDGTVNILDAIQLSNAFLSTPSSSNWNPNADLNGDGVVNILDAIILSNQFGSTHP